MRKLFGLFVLFAVLAGGLAAIAYLQHGALAPLENAAAPTTAPAPEAGPPAAPAPEAYAPDPSKPLHKRSAPRTADDREPEPSAAAPEPPGVTEAEEDAAGSRGFAVPESTPMDSAPTGAPPPAGTPAIDEPSPVPPAEPADEAAAAAPDDEYDVVPVYFGTDRVQEPKPTRLDYGSGRGRRLELGFALVTVPKAHITPAIERPWALRVPYLNVTLYEETEDPNRHFTMKEVQALSEEEFLKLVQERIAASSVYKDHALIFIHGYNTTFDYAIYRAAQISYDLKFDGAAFAYSWPSGGGLASYTYDRESSGQAEPFLREFIKLVSEKSGAKSVSIIAHSMGNQPTLQVLRDLRRQSPGEVRINQIILAAPDVDRDNFENIAAEIQGVAKGVTLYAASNDRALLVSRNFYGGVPRAGDVPSDVGPLVLPGLDTVDATAASMDSLGLNHSGYAENNTLLDDIARLIMSGTRPPASRTPTLEEVLTDKGTYWRFPTAQR